MRATGAGAVALLAALAAPCLARGQTVTIEKATVPWSELERLMRREGQPLPAPPKAGAPTAWSMTGEVNGEIGGGSARLRIHAEISVLADRWVVAPLLPESLAVSSAQVEAPDGRRGLLVRSSDGVALAADGVGRYELDLEAEGPLETVGTGSRLLWAPPGLAGGRARLEVHGGERIAGRSAWRLERGAHGVVVAQAALGAGGLELLLQGPDARGEASATLEELRALTVLSLGGSGVTRLTVRAIAAEGELTVVLPQGAKLWKAYVGSTALKASSVSHGASVTFPVRGSAEIELAYTFDSQPMGIRGHWRVEMPRLPVTVRDARWEVWLPSGLKYHETQAALSQSRCSDEPGRARTTLDTQGSCNGFARAVLEPGRAYVEGLYEQPL